MHAARMDRTATGVAGGTPCYCVPRKHQSTYLRYSRAVSHVNNVYETGLVFINCSAHAQTYPAVAPNYTPGLVVAYT